MQQEKFDLWCIVELFGHQKIAGRCTEQNVAGTNMLRVDVPPTTTQPPFTRIFGSAAIYAINPVDKDTAKFYAEQLDTKPIEAWNVKEMLAKNDALRLKLTNGTQEIHDEQDEADSWPEYEEDEPEEIEDDDEPDEPPTEEIEDELPFD